MAIPGDKTKTDGAKGSVGFWSGETIRRRQAELVKTHEKPLIPANQWCDERVQPASYRLCVGDEIYVSSPLRDGKYPVKEILEERESRSIPPGQFAFIISEEEVHIPRDAIGFITLRLKPTKFKGLVNVSGFHVDPSYTGKLVFSVYNAGPSPVQVTRGAEWFEIFYASLDQRYEGDAKKGYDSIPPEILMPGPLDTLDTLRDEIRDAEDRLDDRLQRIERENGVLRWAVALAITFFIAFSVKSCVNQPTTQALSSITEIGTLAWNA